MIQIAVCDDNLNELSNLIQLVNQYRLTKHLNCEYTAFLNGFELIDAIEKGKRFDIYCLDIMMPGYTGIEVAKEIRALDKRAQILFFTSSPEFALESYSVNAINYVLKPIHKDKFFETFDDVLEKLNFEATEEAIIVKSSDGIQKILISNLVYVEVVGRNVLYHLRSGKIVKCSEPFSAACDSLLKYKRFIKTHRSFVMNMQYVDVIGNTQITLQTQSCIPISQGKSKEIKQLYLAYQMDGE